MATETVSERSTKTAEKNVASLSVTERLFPSRTRRLLRENLTAYLFLTPATLLLFTFGIFPIFYAIYVSLFKWRIRQGEYRGLSNYISAMGDVGFIFFAVIALVLLVFAVTVTWRLLRLARAERIPLYFALLAFVPAGALGWGMVALLLTAVTVFAQDEANKMGSLPLGLFFLAIGGFLTWGLNRWQQFRVAASPYAYLPNLVTPALSAVLTGGVGLALAYFTYDHLLTLPAGRQAAAVVRIQYLSGGLAALFVAFLLWNWSSRQSSNWRLVGGLATAVALIGAGIYLVSIWPVLRAEGDPDFFLSLSVTIFFSLGTVPIQLAIAMLLANLLYQNIRLKGFFRVIFFIPYIAPAVATAGIFEAIFSIRATSFANLPLSLLGLPPLAWLKEGEAALVVLGETLGIDALTAISWGPSLALLVVILYNIWVYVGYDTVIFLAGLGNIPSTLYEAAKIDGAGRWSLFRHITLPLLSPTTYFLSVISVIGTFKAFNGIWVLRDTDALGTVDTASVYFFQTFFRGSRFGYATSMAVVLFVIILVLYLVQNRIAARKVFYG